MRIIIIYLLVLVLCACSKNDSEISEHAYDDCVLKNLSTTKDINLLDQVKMSCKGRNPKKFDFESISNAANVKQWTDVAATSAYKDASDDEKNEIKEQYFSDVVRPRVHVDYVNDAHLQFMAYTRSVK